MSLRIEDYAMIGDTHTVALVGTDGSIDWLCLPRFDSPSVFTRLLGTADHGHWQISPRGGVRRVTRRYRADTLILETDLETTDGEVRLIDLMPVRDGRADVLRIVEGRRGRVPMRMDLVLRFDYGSIVPWVERMNGRLLAFGGPDAMLLETPLPTHGEHLTTVSEFEVSEGDRIPFRLTWFPSHEQPPASGLDCEADLAATEQFWTDWSSGSRLGAEWRDEAMRSLITLKALTYAPTGGSVAAPTTSLPEHLGGVRNWDYRYCWLRDATFVLSAFINSGHRAEAEAWRGWLIRAVGGDPDHLQIMYGIGGERRLPEHELDWLPGHEGSRPVRIGNGAAPQLQLDAAGMVFDALHLAQTKGVAGPGDEVWAVKTGMLDLLERRWVEPDSGLWEARAERRHYTHSKVMSWVAFDRAVKTIERYGMRGPLDRWRAVRQQIHDEVCEQAWSDRVGAFTMSYGSDLLDASLLTMPLVGFLPVDDPRVQATIRAIEQQLAFGDFLLRYETPDSGVDGLPPGEGAFLLCTAWLANCYAMAGRLDRARDLTRRLIAISNDVGLLAEQYDPVEARMLGNFPQAFSHLGLVSAINAINGWGPPSEPEE
ncbi:MAG: glycoside hydrolase family 15 protein [Acidimicrobiales bacterium]|nr:glycoside hydrolase family 15 protein [Acidimicrobiales bacterium]